MLDDNINYSNLEATIMDQGPNALVAAAAAFAVLGAPHPTTAFTQPAMHTSNSTATIYTLLCPVLRAVERSNGQQAILTIIEKQGRLRGSIATLAHTNKHECNR